ncbi:MAG: endonuclease/exonuclease/phosphatase family protein [Phycisphaerales bacterium]|jgi:endonuclease/exonuclease/phosphatase family metal-dependent hydrolase|nr:endonuclease/exonuclease/phosphatase family protein [Phycisphaerales bacterium]
MRIVSYNILDGGLGRADPLAEVIEAQRPDLVGLVEADDEAVVRRIAHRLGMDWVWAAGNMHALAILSRHPIVETINHAPNQPKLSRGLLQVGVRVGQTPVEIVLTHLHPYATEADEDRRQEELDLIFSLIDNRPAVQVLMGDFNSNSPIQQIDPSLCKPSTRNAWDANGGLLPRRVIQSILDHGFIDSLEAFDLASAQSAGTFSTQFPGQRVDYIFLRGIERHTIQSAWIEQDRLAKYAGDHFPVGVEIIGLT